MNTLTDDEAEALDFAERSLSQQALACRAMPFMDGLNPAQRDAVVTLEGPVLVLAGAGTGKTKALTARIARLLSLGNARPNEILAVTFTNRAAREMRQRVGSLVGGVVEGMPWLGTFHSLSVRLLRRHAELAGLKANFTILDTDDQIRLLKQLIQAEGIDERRWPPRLLASIIDGWKNRALTPEHIPNAEAGAYDHRGAELYARYQERLRTLNACDFGDLLLHVVRILQKNHEILARYQTSFRYILVDEYQDTNIAQYLWLRLLAGGHRNICCVGDDDQSIYGWRGAEVGNILRFEKEFPNAAVIRLEQNYRSTPHILAAASGVIVGNESRLGKTLWTETEHGEKVRLIGHWDGEEEARWISEEIEALVRGTRELPPVSPDGIAILVRASFQMRAFEDRFLTIGLPYRVIGGPRFYERQEIRDAMAYFRVAVSPDDGLAFERIVNRPKRGIGEKAVQEINRTARENEVSLLEGARILVERKGLSSRARNALKSLLSNIDRWHGTIIDAPLSTVLQDDSLVEEELVGAEAIRFAGKPYSHVELAEQILDESGYTDMWRNDRSPDSPGRLENLKELVKALEEFENLQGFLEHVSLVMENEQDDGAPKVSIMTLHGAKGLEFPCVFLPGWEDGLFPSQRSMDESGLKGLEEERRLAYVGITRAMKLCTISFAANRRFYNQWQSQLPSRFIDELPASHVEVLTPPGLYGGGYGAAASGRSEETVLADAAAKADVYNSPGWKRMQARSRNQPSPQTGPRKGVIDIDESDVFLPGTRVFHQKFGYGTIAGADGDKVLVEFDKAGSKNVIARFITVADNVPF